MMKIIISLLFAAACAAPASCGELLPASDGAFFSALNSIKSTALQAAPVQIKPQKAEPVSRSRKVVRYVHVSGHVTLNGSAFVSDGSNFVSVNLSGFTNISDASGRITSGTVSVSHWSHLYISNSWVSDWASPSFYVSFYENGRYIGNAQISGSFYITGNVSGNWLYVSGSGMINGTLAIREP